MTTNWLMGAAQEGGGPSTGGRFRDVWSAIMQLVDPTIVTQYFNCSHISSQIGKAYALMNSVILGCR